MDTAQINVSKDQARTALRQYRAHVRKATDEDEAILRAYRSIARGNKVIRAFESIREAGLDEEGLPRLAIIRADHRMCWCSVGEHSVRFQADRYGSRGDIYIRWDTGMTSARAIELGHDWMPGGKAMVPLVPLHLRPAQNNLRSYHILWEADWHKAPVDPLLLKRLKGDLWAVVAAWELTDVERAVLEDRH